MKAKLTFKYVIPDSTGRIARQIFKSIVVDLPDEIMICETNANIIPVSIKDLDLFCCEYVSQNKEIGYMGEDC
jgi:hypothetical protein